MLFYPHLIYMGKVLFGKMSMILSQVSMGNVFEAKMPATATRDTQHNGLICDTQYNDAQDNDAQDNDAQDNDAQDNDAQYNDTQHNNIQHNNTQHNGLIGDTMKNDAQHNSLESHYDECRVFYCFAECHYADCRGVFGQP